MGNAKLIITRGLAALVILFPAMSFGQALHPDYLDASAGSPQLRRLRPDAPSAETANYKARLIGYLQSAEAEQAPPGTAVRAAPTTASALLATVESGDSITVTKRGQWSKVVLRRPAGSPVPLSGAEVDPVVLGRKAWTPGEPPLSDASAPGSVRELDPLEAEENSPDNITLPVKPPGPLPAINLNRNFEGLLVLKTRSFGFQKNLPYQLLNPAGKFLAYVDVSELKAVDALDFNDRFVTILGTMEPVKEGSKKKIIRARLIRPRN